MLGKIGDFFNKTKNFISKIKFRRLFKISIITIYTVAIILLTYAVINTFFKPDPIKIYVDDKEEIATVNVKVLESTLIKNAQLSTAQLKFKAESHYKGKKGIPGITKSEFTVLFEATVKAGFDMKKVGIKADDKKRIIYIDMPKAEIKKDDVYIDHSKLQFFDKKFVLFPVDVQEHTAKALALSEKVASKYAYECGILDMANKQGIEIVKGILSNVIPAGYKFEVAQKQQ